MNLAIDIDGILADFNEGHRKQLKQLNDGVDLIKTWPPQIWEWDIEAYGTKFISNVWANHIAPSKSFWKSLQPLDGTLDAVKQLNRLSKHHAIYFITNRMGINCKQQTETWLYGVGMNYPTVIIAGDKVPVLKALKINFFIDDKLETMNELMAAAQSQKWDMRDKHFFLAEAPYNKHGRRSDLKATASLTTGLKEIGLWL